MEILIAYILFLSYVKKSDQVNVHDFVDNEFTHEMESDSRAFGLQAIANNN